MTAPSTKVAQHSLAQPRPRIIPRQAGLHWTLPTWSLDRRHLESDVAFVSDAPEIVEGFKRRDQPGPCRYQLTVLVALQLQPLHGQGEAWGVKAMARSLESLV
jgi:hypothetical protein